MNLMEIGGSLDRYKERNGAYPEKLADLYPDFLEKRSMLHCPVDKAPGSTVSYTYARPTDKTPSEAVIASCKRHSFGGMFRSGMTLMLRKNGKVDVVPDPPAAAR